MQGKKEQPTTGKELVYVEQTSLEAIGRKNPILAAGFTPSLPVRFKELNDVLAAHEGSPIKFVEIVSYPDSEFPMQPLVRTEFKDHLKVTLQVVPPSKGSIKSDPSPGGVYLAVGEDSSDGTLSLVYLNDLQNFVRQLAPGKKAHLFWSRTQVPGRDSVDETVLADFLALTQSEFDKLPAWPYSLVIDGQPEPMFKVGNMRLLITGDTACLLSKFRFYWTGEAGGEAERAMELLSRLLDYKNSASAPRTAETELERRV